MKGSHLRIAKCEEDFLEYYSLVTVGIVRYALVHIGKPVWCWYKAMHGPAGFSFGLLLQPTWNVLLSSF